jgi:hypothetical protein
MKVLLAEEKLGNTVFQKEDAEEMMNEFQVCA